MTSTRVSAHTRLGSLRSSRKVSLSSSSPGPFDTLPSEIISRIASYADERSIFMMMATCHAVRGAAERELKPYLEEKVVTGDGSLLLGAKHFASQYNRLNHDQTTKKRNRQKIARRAADLFARHLTAYPPAASHLRRLTIEVGDDDEKTGWEQIIQLGPQLQHLGICVYDARWKVRKENPGPSHRDITPEDNIPPHLASILLSSMESSDWATEITSLKITAAHRALTVLEHIAPYLPHLRDLTLESLFQDKCGESSAVNNSDQTSFVRLEKLSITGTPFNIVNVLRVIKAHRPPSKHLSLSPFPGPKSSRLLPRIISEALREYSSSLCGLSLNGASAHALLCPERRPLNFPLLSILLLKRDGSGPYPLLHKVVSENRPILPVLERIVWITRTDRPSAVPSSPSKSTSSFSQSHNTRLKSLFEEYDSLQQVRCAPKYPSDPFALNAPTRAQEIDPMTVTRSDILYRI